MNKILIGFISIVFVSCTKAPSQTIQKISVTQTVTDSIPQFVRIKNLPNNFDTVPGGNNVYRSSQPSLKQLREILTTYDIAVVVRMNAEEGTGVSIEEERKLVESLNKRFVWVNAHMGYQPGRGYVTSLYAIQPLMHDGCILIHCTHGADRTGYQVAKYLQDEFQWDKERLWNYTTKYNNWKSYIPAGKQGYIKYMEAFYPYEEWKKKH